MKRYLTNIKIENDYAYLFFSDNTIKTLLYTKKNQTRLLNYLNNHKYFYENKLTDIKLYIFLNKLALFIFFLLTIIAIITINSIISISIILTILTNISIINFGLLKSLKQDIKGITNLINIINDKPFFNEIVKDDEKKMITPEIIDLDLYRKIKLYQDMYYQYEKSYKERNPNFKREKEKCKILEFKRK